MSEEDVSEKPRKKRRMRGALGSAIQTVVMLVLLWVVGFGGFFAYVTLLSPPDDKIKTDAIVVLTGGANRIAAGLEMLRAGEAEKLFISGVGPGVTQTQLLAHASDGAHKTPCCITLGRKAHNTIENAAETKDWGAEEHVKSIRLVTAAYHMPRAWVEFHAAMPDVDLYLCPAPPATEGYEKDNAFYLIFIEYNKTLLAALRLLTGIKLTSDS